MKVVLIFLIINQNSNLCIRLQILKIFLGLQSLWSGLTPTLILAVPATVMYFVAYDEIRQRYTRQYLIKFPSKFL